jgi:precorrin-3B synthase
MTARSAAIPERRGICPGLSQPLPTGDGLLARLIPTGTISFDAFAGLCGAARRHGNGIIEITARGSIQARGLSAASARPFAAAVAALGIAATEGVPVLCNPLAGLEREEIFDATAVADALRRTLAEQATAEQLDPKVSVIIDGGGILNLTRVPADIRLGAQRVGGEPVLRVAVGGDEGNATELGLIAPQYALDTVLRLLAVLAHRGARARDVIAAEGAAPFHEALSIACGGHEPRPHHGTPRRSSDVIGLHSLRDGSLACGIGLAFGHAEAAALETLAATATAARADGLRAAPGRALLVLGLTAQAMPVFLAAAERLGFVTRPNDPRRHVIACAGAPLCASAYFTSRSLAPQIARSAAPYLGEAAIIHVSGCAKGCAHAAAAALTITGTADGCALVANGTPRDASFATVAANDLPVTVAQYLRASHEAPHA